MVLPNAKHERFAQEVAKGKTSDEAYVLAGYAKSRKNAQRLRTNEGVSRRIEEILSASAKKAGVTVERVLEALARLGFDDTIKPADQISALEKLGKHLGMFKEKIEHSGETGLTVKLVKFSGS